MNDAKLQAEIVTAPWRANSLAMELSLLRNGRRDLALPLFEKEDDCENIKKACQFLKRRQRPLALEALETELDHRVVRLVKLLPLAEPEDRNKILEALRSIRDYRRENPRRFEADLSYFDKETLEKTRALWDEAEKILNESGQPSA